MRLIDTDELIKTYEKETGYSWKAKGILECPKCFIDNAPTVKTNKIEHKAYNDGFKDGVEQGIKLSARPKGDLISREALKKTFDDYFELGKFIIDNAPTVEAIPHEVHEKAMDVAIADLFKVQEELNRIRNEKKQGECANCVTCDHFGNCEGCEKREEE